VLDEFVVLLERLAANLACRFVSLHHVRSETLAAWERRLTLLAPKDVNVIRVRVAPVLHKAATLSSQRVAQVARERAHVVARASGGKVIPQPTFGAAIKIASTAHGHRWRRYHAVRARTLAVGCRRGWRARCKKLVTVLPPSMALQARSIDEHDTAVGARERATLVQMGLHVSF
jgi:hypothetical protein